ncbi:hypothetical protein LTR10_011815 [Elasticomyces elasticus]|uniref:Major facilitator superfamily (MFS) profile domain-containing protein n=1 Tax=Exophiala sideris TaxID=1016849 RepID=A0ABR0JDL2_9EURO|nr:hypothetical protein LTR10_011815 [Elasticomyces elasticus]KAK5031728.1 hypothetical protein LTS07_004348 [Exophiala sideris]KAK5040657.1 hypothetical protein LTR13_002957 [Exophiala sideris]KAK5062009.1 hypothetical protein LTR69_005193 [Exophiala sideris]KAK5184709.1 hypothetical protein LTR44_003384 [Eurotiomycetes sp. CCFEE 6388]
MHPKTSQAATHVEHYHGRQFRFYNIIMLLIMAIGSMAFGYANAGIAPVAAQPSFIHTFDLDKRGDANNIFGLMNSLYFAGGFFGCLSSSLAADKWGRRWGIAIPTLITILASSLMSGSVNIPMFLFFRFVSGFGGFMLLAAIPVWMSEIAPPNIRGALVSVHNLALLIGYSVATWIGYGFFFIDSTKIWRGQFGIQPFLALLLLPFLLVVPESPRWLLLKDRIEEAEKVLFKLHPEEEARIELLQIQRQFEIDRHLQTSWLSMFTKRSYRKRVMIGFGLTVSVQLCGPLVINNYGPTVYALLGYPVEKQLLYLAGWVTTSIAGSLCSLYLIQIVPRPTLFAAGMIASVACLCAEAGLVAKYATTAEALAQPNEAALNAAVAMFYVFIFVLECTLGGVQYVYLGEIFPTHIRSKGMAIGTSGLSFMNTIWLQAAPVAFSTIGWKFYLCFICPATVAAVVIFLYFPDTKGLPLESVGALFGDEVVEVTTDQATLKGHEESAMTRQDLSATAVSARFVEKDA